MPVAQSGRRHLLVLYTYMLNRWWRAVMAVGVALLILAAGLGSLPLLLPQSPSRWYPDFTVWVTGGSGAFAILMAIFLITIRKSAYVQPFNTHLRLVTPFLRMNISYHRLRQTTSAEMRGLFPIQKFKGSKRAILEAFAQQTAIVLDMNGWPISPEVLHLFLSPFFFPDKSPRLALLVPDWLKFSTELESFRSAWRDSLQKRVRTPQQELLSSILKPKR